MTRATRRQVLEEIGLRASAAQCGHSASVRRSRTPFFLALDKGQVKDEMLRAHAIGGLSATVAAERHGYSRAAFDLITTAFDQVGMRGPLDEPRGRRGPLKLTAEMMGSLSASADPTLVWCATRIGSGSALWCNPHRA